MKLGKLQGEKYSKLYTELYVEESYDGNADPGKNCIRINKTGE